MKHWEERVSEDQLDAIEQTADDLSSGAIDTLDAYENLTRSGMTAEEADEYIGAITG